MIRILKFSLLYFLIPFIVISYIIFIFLTLNIFEHKPLLSYISIGMIATSLYLIILVISDPKNILLSNLLFKLNHIKDRLYRHRSI